MQSLKRGGNSVWGGGMVCFYARRKKNLVLLSKEKNWLLVNFKKKKVSWERKTIALPQQIQWPAPNHHFSGPADNGTLHTKDSWPHPSSFCNAVPENGDSCPLGSDRVTKYLWSRTTVCLKVVQEFSAWRPWQRKSLNKSAIKCNPFLGIILEQPLHVQYRPSRRSAAIPIDKTE